MKQEQATIELNWWESGNRAILTRTERDRLNGAYQAAKAQLDAAYWGAWVDDDDQWKAVYNTALDARDALSELLWS